MRKLKVCHISDPHGKHKYLKVPECDVLICSGDISMMGYKNEVESFFTWFKKQAQVTYKILVGGNHDLTFDPQRGGNSGDKPEWLKKIIEGFEIPVHGGARHNFYLENESCDIWGVKFWGSPTSAEFHRQNWAFNVNQEESEALYSTIPSGTDVVITHGPAFGYGDWCRDINGPVGDNALLFHMKRVKPLLHMFGHIHESYGYYPSAFDTQFFNGCNCDLSYEIANEPWLLDVDFDKREVRILNKNQ